MKVSSLTITGSTRPRELPGVAFGDHPRKAISAASDPVRRFPHFNCAA
jgi:hypothetical protein